MSDKLDLYCSAFCPFSQRIEIAMLESKLSYEKHSFPGGENKVPKWLLRISPRGILPFLKHRNRTFIGSDAIEAFLESRTKLVSSKTKQYNHMIIQCKKIIEPILNQLKDESNKPIQSHLVTLFDSEMSFFEKSIKGPFVLGSSLSWVDIYYWTVLQQIPLLTHLHHFHLPLAYVNIKQWLDRVSKRASFLHVAHDTSAFISHFDQLSGRGNIKPASCVLEFTDTINNALRRGIENLIVKCKKSDFFKWEETRPIFSSFNDFKTVFREHSFAKIDVLIKEYMQREIGSLESLTETISKQKQTITVLHILFEQIAIYTSPGYDEKHFAGDTSKSTLLGRQNKQSSLKRLQEKIVCTMERFHIAFCEDLQNEQKILSDFFSQHFSTYELSNLHKRMVFHPSDDVLLVYIPWIVSNIDMTQIRSVVLYYRFVMPFRFQEDIIPSLKIGLTSALWRDVLRVLEDNKTKEEGIKNTKSDQVPGSPFPARKYAVAAKHLIPLSVTKKQHSVHLTKKQILDDEMATSHPLFVFQFMNHVLTTKLSNIRTICITGVALVNLNELQESLYIIFSFFSVKHQQEEAVLYPFLQKKRPETLSVVHSYLYDSKKALEQMVLISGHMVRMRAVPVSTDDTEEFINQIICYISLELHFLYKQEYLYELLFQTASYEEQGAIIRNLLDRSPTSFVDSLIPWAINQLSNDKQTLKSSPISFVAVMKDVLPDMLFSKVMLPIRRVLPATLGHLLATGNHNIRKSC